jgi:beta-ribofuranosylaminobenzene 5'-phosphate synthase
MGPLVHVAAPSRLHFGLWSLGGTREDVRQFGGVGAMIDRPGLELSIRPSAELVAVGPMSERAAVFARRWAEFHARELPLCQIDVEAAPPEHVGLGTGTQLGLAVAAGLNAYCGLPSQSPQELALSVGRGLRSAVGTYGFVMGGLVVEQGKLPGEPISPLDCRIDLPADWRFVLVRHVAAAGLSGEEEAAAMAELPTVPAAVTEELIGEVRERLVPAAATTDFPAFAASLYRYGHLSGECFAARQGGPYNGPVLTSLVEQLRAMGFEGVGQSSWGPTLFVAAESEAAAAALQHQLQQRPDAAALHVEISRPCNRGVRIEVTAPR